MVADFLHIIGIGNAMERREQFTSDDEQRRLELNTQEIDDPLCHIEAAELEKRMHTPKLNTDLQQRAQIWRKLRDGEVGAEDFIRLPHGVIGTSVPRWL